MPLSRYQIRNEYSLADPELYRAADKDDPEALLEGVAMAGLVGVLRQLGDLAEFAAELFHDLHEEVMVTAARGHSLIVRVQQLEAEIPAVEKAFLSQTSHSSFLYNPGIGWHPKMHVEQSLVMRGDLPRFIMESYEECRGPPRLFLLDKFDVAGAGASLKRYTDPSFFKLETSSSGTSGTDIQRERKNRKAKKKGSRWRNGETPEVLPMLHVKLHQLFLEERIENGITDPARRVKLRKRLNGYPFDTKSGKSYMDRFLKSPSPDHNEPHDIPVDSTPLLLPSNGNSEHVSDIANIKIIAPEKKSKERLRSPSPVKERTYQIVSPTEKPNEIASGTGLAEVLTLNSGLQSYSVRDPCFKVYNVPSIPPAANNEKVIPVDGGSNESVGDYQSDDIASEVEHYMDALTTIESEIDTDTELKAKNNLGYFNSRRQLSDLYGIDNQFQTISSESQSVGNSTLSDDGNSSLKKGISSFSSSDTHSPTAPSDGAVSSIVFPCNHQIEVHDTSIAQLSVAVKDTASQAPGSTASDGASTGITEVSGSSSELVNLISVSSPFDIAASHINANSLETRRDLVGPETNKSLSYRSSNTATTNTVQQPARDDSPSRISHNNQFTDELDVVNYETGQNLPDSSCPFGPSNSKDKSSLKEMLGDYDNNKYIHYPNPDESVASVSCFLDPAVATDENVPILTDLNEKMDEVNSRDLNLSQKASLQSNLSDVALRLREDSSPEMSGRNVLVVEFGSIQPNPVVEIATDTSYGQPLNDILEARSAEDLQTSDEGQICLQRVVIPSTETHNLDPVTSDVDNICPSTGEMTFNATTKEDTAIESVEYVAQKVAADLPTKKLKQGTSDSEDGHFERTSDTEDDAILKREGNCDIDLLGTDRTSNTLLVGENFAQVHFKVSYVGAESFETTLGTAAKKDISGELLDNVSERVSDLPLVRSKQGISDGEEEHFEWSSGTEDAALQREAGCNLDLDTDSVSNPSFLGENVQVHLAVSSVAAGREGVEDADASSTDLKNLVEVSLPAYEVENIGLEAEKVSPVDETQESSVADNVHQEKLAAPDSVSTLIDADDYDTSGRERSDDVLNQYSASDNVNSDKNIPVQSSAKRCEWEASFVEENVDLLDEIVPSKVKEELITKASQILWSEETIHVSTVDVSSEPMLESLCSQPLVPECLSQGSSDVDVPEQSMDLSTSVLSIPFLLPDTSHVFVEEMPPLPPLPPVQWRMTKFQHAFPAQGRLAVQHNAKAFPPLFQSGEDQDIQPLNVVMMQSNLDHERSSLVSEHATEEVTHSRQSLASVHDLGDTKVASVHDLGDTKVDVRALEPSSYTDSFLHLPGSHDDILPYHFWAQKEDEARLASVLHLPTKCTASENYYGEHTKLKNQMASGASSAGDELRQKSEISDVTFVESYDTKRLPSRIEDTLTQHAMPDSASWLSVEKTALYTSEVTRNANLEEERIMESSALSNVNAMTYGTTSQQPSKTKTDQPPFAISTTEGPLVWPAVEDYHKENGSEHIKLPRPRNPLIDAVVAHDKSKLRKVTVHARPEVRKVDDKGSILEQIRTKSFNLKPAVVSRPSIQGPATNLKVAAILEKAKTIRQAFAGSDEDDDDDSWSDS